MTFAPSRRLQALEHPRPTYLSSGLYQCDKCDDWFWMIDDTRYGGTEAQLKRESAAN